MFTLEQVADIHNRLGGKDTLVAYLGALRKVGVKSYDSYVSDGHSEYRGDDGKKLVGPPYHKFFAISETCDREWFSRYMKQVEQGGIGYVEMSKSLADHGVEKWTFDTEKLTITYYDKAGKVLLSETVE